MEFILTTHEIVVLINNFILFFYRGTRKGARQRGIKKIKKNNTYQYQFFYIF